MLQSDFQLTGHMGNTPYCLDEIHIEQSCDDEVVDWFELHITVVVGNLRIPFSRFRKHILEEKREYLLPDGRMILYPRNGSVSMRTCWKWEFRQSREYD